MSFDQFEHLSDPSFAAVGFAIALLGAALGLWFYAVSARRWNPWWVLAPALTIAGVTLLRVTVTSGIDSDESEHLHVAYLIGHGAMPYRDFDQNHSAFLWMGTAPLLRLLPETPYILYLFRALSLASFLASVTIACSLAKQLLRGSGLVAPLCVFLALATAVNTEVYRFRPDPFMNLCALASLHFLLKPGADRTRWIFLAGVLQGVAVALSPKLLQLGLLAPVILFALDRDQLKRGTLTYGVGVALGLAPLLGWLGWHGLLQDAYLGIVGSNLSFTTRRLAEGMSNEPDVYASEMLRLSRLAPIFLLTGISCLRMLRQPDEGRAMAALLAAAWVLWLGVWLLSPNTSTYHIAGSFVIGAVFGAHALEALALRRRLWPQLALGILLSLCLTDAPLRSGLGGWVDGYTYPLARVNWLLDEVRSRGGGCLCLVPWHPIFIATPSPIYVSNQRGSRRWGEALEWAESRRPAAVMSRRFSRMAEQGKISQTQSERTIEFLRKNYELHSAGRAGFWLLREEPRT